MVKRVLRGLAVGCMALCLLFPAQAYALGYGAPAVRADVPPELEAAFDAALLIDRNTKAALFEKETGRAFSPTGGAVNLMAAYIVMREADLEQTIPISNAVYDLSPSVRKVDLLPGQRWPMKDLLAAMLLYGAQDAALVLCEHVGGSQEGFIEMMNQSAKDLGMEDTLYQNCLGAYAQGQATTVADLMRLCEAALANDGLRELLAMSEYAPAQGTTIRNRIDLMQPGRTGHDARIKGIGEGSTASAGTNTLLYAVGDGGEWLFVGYTEADDQSAGEQNALAAFDHAAGAYAALDVTDIVKNLLAGQTIEAGGAAVVPAAAADHYVISVEKAAAAAMGGGAEGFALAGLPLLEAAPQVGEAIGATWLRYMDQDVLEIPLLAGSEAQALAATDAPAGAAAQEDAAVEIPVYSAADWQGADREKSFLSRYASWIIIGSAALLAVAVLLIARILRGKQR